VSHGRHGRGVVEPHSGSHAHAAVRFDNGDRVTFLGSIGLEQITLLRPAIGQPEDWSNARLLIEVEQQRARAAAAEAELATARREWMFAGTLALDECDRLRAERDRLITGITELAAMAALGGKA
jgi:hypothetical protein